MESALAVIVHLDTSVLIDSLVGPRRSLAALERTVMQGHVIATSTLALYEWLRGPRTPAELEDQEGLIRSVDARSFGPSEAARAASLYRVLKRARGRELDLAIAACAIEHGAQLWTINRDDFKDLPGLKLYNAE